MRYTLYTRSGTPTAIDVAYNEYDLCGTMSEYYKTNPYERFMIVGREKDEPPFTKSINSVEEYIDYYQELETRRLKEMDIMGLRQEMMDIVYDKPKVKTKRK